MNPKQLESQISFLKFANVSASAALILFQGVVS